jgi:hypothetical protein
MAKHADTVCTQKQGSRINTSVVSFIYGCPVCGAEWRFARPKPKEDVIHDGEDFKVDNFLNPNPIPNDEQEAEAKETRRVKSLLMQIENGDDRISEEEYLFLELKELVEKKTRIRLTHKGQKKLE